MTNGGASLKGGHLKSGGKSKVTYVVRFSKTVVCRKRLVYLSFPRRPGDWVL